MRPRLPLLSGLLSFILLIYIGFRRILPNPRMSLQSDENHPTVFDQHHNPPVDSVHHPPPPPSLPANMDMTAPLRTRGRYIVDASGHRVKLASINWYGASDVDFVPGGLDFRHRRDIAASIRAMGFNSVRFPYSDQMVLQNPVVDPVHLSANLDLLKGWNASADSSSEETDTSLTTAPRRALDVFHACVQALTDAGLAVVINNHITNAAWCDGKNLCDASWKNSHYGPICAIRQTTDSWIANWLTIMTPHIANPLVIGADLRNEPRGLWGTMTWDAWATAAEAASEALLALQPDWLMFVEGVSSANDCSGARTRPVVLSVPHRVVYSAHVYSWSGWGSPFAGGTYGRRPWESFAKDMERNWAFLLSLPGSSPGDEGQVTAPVWIGEFGAPREEHGGMHDRIYWDHLMRFLAACDADWGYWALNPRKPGTFEDETYAVLRDDWETVVEDYRMEGLRGIMAPLRG